MLRSTSNLAELNDDKNAAFKKELLQYRAERLKEIPTNYNQKSSHYRRWFFCIGLGSSAGEKINAVDLLLKDLNGTKVNYDEPHLLALRNSRLGKIVNKYQHLLPENFRRQENVRLIRALNEFRR